MQVSTSSFLHMLCYLGLQESEELISTVDSLIWPSETPKDVTNPISYLCLGNCIFFMFSAQGKTELFSRIVWLCWSGLYWLVFGYLTHMLITTHRNLNNSGFSSRWISLNVSSKHYQCFLSCCLKKGCRKIFKWHLHSSPSALLVYYTTSIGQALPIWSS